MAVDAVLAEGARRYKRERDLPRLLPRVYTAGRTDAARAVDVIRDLKLAILKERTLGVSGHRTYNLVRHLGLAQALRAEELQATGREPT